MANEKNHPPKHPGQNDVPKDPRYPGLQPGTDNAHQPGNQGQPGADQKK